jgi:hypothetical protein
VQRWTPRRVVLWLGLLVVVVLLGVNYYVVFGDKEASRTPIQASSLDCSATHELEPLWLEAQSVQSAGFVPCVAALPVGWSLGHVHVNSGRSGYSMNHDRAGDGALEATLTRRCDVAGADEVAPVVEGSRRYVREGDASGLLEETYDVMPGGCITTRLSSRSAVPEVVSEVTRDASAVAGYVSRDALAAALAARSDGRLHLDPA